MSEAWRGFIAENVVLALLYRECGVSLCLFLAGNTAEDDFPHLSSPEITRKSPRSAIYLRNESKSSVSKVKLIEEFSGAGKF